MAKIKLITPFCCIKAQTTRSVAWCEKHSIDGPKETGWAIPLADFVDPFFEKASFCPFCGCALPLAPDDRWYLDCFSYTNHSLDGGKKFPVATYGPASRAKILELQAWIAEHFMRTEINRETLGQAPQPMWQWPDKPMEKAP